MQQVYCEYANFCKKKSKNGQKATQETNEQKNHTFFF